MPTLGAGPVIILTSPEGVMAAFRSSMAVRLPSPRWWMWPSRNSVPMCCAKDMFTGLIEAVGRVSALRVSETGFELRLQTPLAAELTPGDSLAVNGARQRLPSV